MGNAWIAFTMFKINECTERRVGKQNHVWEKKQRCVVGGWGKNKEGWGEEKE